MQFQQKYFVNGAAIVLGLFGMYRIIRELQLETISWYQLLFGVAQCAVAIFLVFRTPAARWAGMLVGAQMFIAALTTVIVLKITQMRIESLAPSLISESTWNISLLDWSSGVFGAVLVAILILTSKAFNAKDNPAQSS